MKRIAIISLLLLTGLTLVAQDIVVTTEAPKVVTIGEQFRITWIVNTRAGSLEAPEFKDFYLLMGPQTSYSQNTSYVNGKRSQTIRNSFTYYLQATKEGKYTVGPAVFTNKNDKYESRTVTIEVIDAEEQARTESGAANQEAERTETAQSSGVKSSDLYIRLLVNRTKVSIGEHIVATLKIYSKVNLSGIQEVTFPDFNGFLKTDLETTPLRALERENVNGQLYNTGVLQRFLIYPQKSGTLTIEPSTLTVLLQERTRNNDPFFGDFFSSISNVPKMLASLPVDIEVAPLPSGEPQSFYGTVGSISLSSDIAADTISVNEALTLSLTIKGSGNLKLSSPPEFLLSPDIEKYDPKIVSNLKATVNGTEGSKTFEYVLIPRHHGQFEIAPIDYSYFDPDRGRYVTLSSDKHKFFARKGEEGNEEAQVFGTVSKENITYLGKDIRYIHSDNVKLRRSTPLIVSRSSFIIMYLSAFLVFISIIVWRREHLKRNADLARVRNRKAAKVATSKLKTAARFLKEGKEEEFYSELLRALWGYLGDKLSIPVSDLNIHSATTILADKKVDEKTISMIIKVIESCEYSKYSPSGETKDKKEIFRSADELIKLIENEIRA